MDEEERRSEKAWARTHVGLNVARWRRKKGLTQEELCALTGYPQQKLSLIEAGKRDFSISTLYRIAKGLGVRMADLVDLENGPDA